MNKKKTAYPSKKELRKEIETKLDNAIGHMAKATDKKIHKLIKKVSRLLADGQHQPGDKKIKPAGAAKKGSTPVKSVSKKSAPKKTAGKK